MPKSSKKESKKEFRMLKKALVAKRAELDQVKKQMKEKKLEKKVSDLPIPDLVSITNHLYKNHNAEATREIK